MTGVRGITFRGSELEQGALQPVDCQLGTLSSELQDSYLCECLKDYGANCRCEKGQAALRIYIYALSTGRRPFP